MSLKIQYMIKFKRLIKELLDIFTLEDQIKLASFVLSYGKSESYRVDEKEAMEHISNWEDN